MFGLKEKKQLKMAVDSLEIHWDRMASKWKYISINPRHGNAPALICKHTEKPRVVKSTRSWEGGERQMIRQSEFDKIRKTLTAVMESDSNAWAQDFCCIARPQEIPGPEVEAPDTEEDQRKKCSGMPSFEEFMERMAAEESGSKRKKEAHKELLCRADEFAKVMLPTYAYGEEAAETVMQRIASDAVTLACAITRECERERDAKPIG